MIKGILSKIIFALVLFSSSLSFAVQHDFILPDNKGGELWADMYQGMKALATQNSGPTDPANPQVLHSIFTGIGINDATSGGTFSASAKSIIGLEIDVAGTPDTFRWRSNSGAWTTGVTITGSAQTITDGITVTFASTTGHTVGDKWFVIGLPGSTIPFQFWADTTTGVLKQRNKANTGWITKGGLSDVKPALRTHTKLLLHADGTGGLFTDSSAYGNTISGNGNVTQTTTESKFGGKSVFFDGAGDFLVVPTSSDFDFGTGDFTIDFWFRTSVPGFRTLFAIGVTRGPYSSVNYALEIAIKRSRKLGVYFSGGPGNERNSESINIVNDSRWHHVAYIREDANLKLYIDGIKNSSSRVGSIAMNFRNFSIGIGGRTNQESFYNGYLDELRVSKGIARWTANFTPPGVPYN